MENSIHFSGCTGMDYVPSGPLDFQDADRSQLATGGVSSFLLPIRGNQTTAQPKGATGA